MIDSTLKISLMNKKTGILSFISFILLLLTFVVTFFSRWEVLIIDGLLIVFYCFQVSMISFVTLRQGKFLIENVFKPTITKDARLFQEVTELMPFTHLMQLKFRDGSTYLFWGKSDMELNRSIRDSIKWITHSDVLGRRESQFSTPFEIE